MKKYMALITLLTLIDEPLQAEHDYWTTLAEGIFVGIVMYWQLDRTWKEKESEEKEIDPYRSLPCGHDYLCPVCQMKNEKIIKENIGNGKKDDRKSGRIPLKRLGGEKKVS